jgi:DNA-binding GntR family transcriptional regulator
MKRTAVPALGRATPKPDRRRVAKRREKAVPSAAHANGNGGPPVKGQDEELTLTETAYRSLEELIVTLQLPPGMVLSEHALVARLGIGRTPIREALQRLGRDGLVQILPRRGILVSEINLKTQLRLLEVRREMERLIAPLSARRLASASSCRRSAQIC